MTEAERLAYRIAANRRTEQSLTAGGQGLSLEGIVAQLNSRKQRATYGAVAEVVGVLPRGLMSGRANSSRYSWIVAATTNSGSRRGSPTGYTKNQIHPDCYRQICEGLDNVIEDGDDLKRWLNIGV
jgi:hypothetical protein